MQNAGFRALKPLPTRISSLFGVLGLLAAQQVAACENPVGRLETAESVVEMRAAASGDWVRIMPAHPLCEGDQVAVRAPGRASVVLEGDILVRLDQNTTLTLTHVPPDADARLGMVEGLIHVITRFRKRFEVNTPFVNAMVEGTEFSVRSADGAGRVVVIEGQVRVANAGGEQTLATGEAAIARGEHAPGKIELRALDTVRWAIHYPQIMWLDATARARLPASLGNTVDAAQSAMAQSKHAEALRLLDAAGPSGQAAELAPLHVSVLLALGRIEPARKLLA
ncbi:MAG TPA: FecR domain-containing protein, partial [Rhodocyclaceae bacterium]|nr:FecR domain-containing protein [Rhodocyclaceae bacterium]